MLVQSGTIPAAGVASENPTAGTGVQGDSAVNLTISAGAALAETVLYSFTGGANGAGPRDLIQGSDGNFYGVSGGGADSQGTLFKVTSSGAQSVVYAFGSQANDGLNPYSLILSADGSFYGTTFGGAGSANGGTVYRVSPSGSEAVLHAFQGYTNPNDGIGPLSLVQGGNGNLYGVTSCGSEINVDTCLTGGIFFKVALQGAETVLHPFGSGTDGTQPSGAVLLAKDGNFYGTTAGGGQFGSGSFFKVTPTGAEIILCSFAGPSTSAALASLTGAIVQGNDGNFYGTANAGGAYGQGAVFSIDAAGAETIVYSFSGCTVTADISPNPVCGISSSVDGAGPGSIIQASDGSLYGTTAGGGSSQSGTVFKITGIPPNQ
jgi:uncharacterized repeat protein (TIGR03803 family)